MKERMVGELLLIKMYVCDRREERGTKGLTSST